MVAFKAYEFEKLLEPRFTKAKIFLIYGPDEDVSSFRISRLISHFKSQSPTLEIERTTADDIQKQSDYVLNLLNSNSLFGNAPIIIANIASRNIVQELTLALSTPISTYLILQAGDLKPNHAMRKFCEAHDQIIAIPSYSENQRDVKTALLQFLKAHNLSADEQTLQILTDIMPNSPQTRAIELEKLRLYMRGNTQISTHNVLDLFVDSSEHNLDSLLFPLFSGSHKASIQALNNVQSQNLHPTAIVLICLKHCFQLLKIQSALQSGQSLDTYFKTATPPIFTSKQDMFRAHLKNVPRGTFLVLHDICLKALKETRSTSVKSELNIQKFIGDIVKYKVKSNIL